MKVVALVAAIVLPPKLLVKADGTTPTEVVSVNVAGITLNRSPFVVQAGCEIFPETLIAEPERFSVPVIVPPEVRRYRASLFAKNNVFKEPVEDWRYPPIG